MHYQAKKGELCRIMFSQLIELICLRNNQNLDDYGPYTNPVMSLSLVLELLWIYSGIVSYIPFILRMSMYRVSHW